MFSKILGYLKTFSPLSSLKTKIAEYVFKILDEELYNTFKSTLKMFMILCISFIAVFIFAPIVILVRIIVKCIQIFKDSRTSFKTKILTTLKELDNFFFICAIGFDQAGGSILYEQEDWTISSRTYYLRTEGKKYAVYFEKVIDFIFGKDHCMNSYIWEKEKHLGI